MSVVLLEQSATRPKTAYEVHVARVRYAMGRSVEAIVQVGDELRCAKDNLPHGQFGSLLAEVGMEPSTAQRFMAVARHEAIANAAHGQHLPASWRTLYELSRLPGPALAEAIEAGEVRPDMQRRDAQNLVRLYLTGQENDALDDEVADHDPVDHDPEVLAGTYATITADPPWQYGNKATRGAAEDHYGTMTIGELCELDVKSVAAPSAHLYLWTTNSFLREAFDVVEAWGFTYKTCLTWVKPQMGLGNYFRSCTEHVLFATKGSLGTQTLDTRNHFVAPRGRHSQKPEAFYSLVEANSPGPYLEMFARRRRMGWATWGDQA